MDYQYRDWICGKAIEANPPELSVWTFESRGDQINGPLYLDLGMHVARTKSTLSLSIYCPFWMVNKTDLMLTYRVSIPSSFIYLFFQCFNVFVYLLYILLFLYIFVYFIRHVLISFSSINFLVTKQWKI